MSNIAIDIFLEQLALGLKLDNGWHQMAGHQNISHQKPLKDMENFGYWGTKPKICQWLRSANGFGWDEENSRVEATKEVWDNYLKSHPKANYFRYHNIDKYDKLCLIVGNDTTIGDCAYSSTEAPIHLGDDSSTIEVNDEEDDEEVEETQSLVWIGG